jgi:hypothetical protein
MRVRAARAHAEQVFYAKAAGLAGSGLGGARGEQALRIVAATLAEREARLEPFLQAFDPSLTGILSEVMQTGKKHGLSFESLAVGRDEIAINGAAPTWTSCDELMGFLRQSGYTVKLRRQAALVNDTVPFTITTGVADE